MIAFDLLCVADLDKPQAMKFFSHELSDPDEGRVFLFLEFLKKGISLSEKKVENGHD